MDNNEMLIDVTQEGAILLGPDVVCDGFYYGFKTRVQSHLHADHMRDFTTSKGYQHILMSPESYDLLVLEENAEIPYRSNIKTIKNNTPIQIGDSEVLLLSSGHMLGAVQTQVTFSNGKRVGYSGDFYWPLEQVIKVDILVVDCTYGSPEKKRHYAPEEANVRLIELIVEKLRIGPIMLQAHRGTLQHALDILCGEINIPLVCPPFIFEEAGIYQKHGYNISQVFSSESKDGQKIINSGRYVYICDTRRHNPAVSLDNMVKIQLSAYMSNPKDPVLKFSDTAYRVALSGHADFEGTLAYIDATRAKEVITDNTRGGYGIELAQEIHVMLNIKARASSNVLSNDWNRY